MTKTTNYQLNQWDAADPIRREDFNADNAAIDAALGQKADQTALDAKAEKTALAAAENALTQARQELSARITAAQNTADAAQNTANAAQTTAGAAWSANNPAYVIGSYQGVGGDDYGSNRKITVGFTPALILITDVLHVYCAISGQSKLNYAALTWDSDGVTLTDTDPALRLDKLNSIYYYCAVR